MLPDLAPPRSKLADILVEALDRADGLGLGTVAIHISHALELLREMDKSMPARVAADHSMPQVL